MSEPTTEAQAQVSPDPTTARVVPGSPLDMSAVPTPPVPGTSQAEAVTDGSAEAAAASTAIESAKPAPTTTQPEPPREDDAPASADVAQSDGEGEVTDFGALDLDDLEVLNELTARLESGEIKAVPDAPEPDSTPAPPAEPVTVTPAATATSEPEAVQPPEVQTPASAEPEDEELPARYRLRPKADFDKQVAAYFAADPDGGFEKALGLAKAKFGVTDSAESDANRLNNPPAQETAEPTEPVAAPAEGEAPKTVAEAHAKRTELRKQLKDATAEMDFEAMAAAQLELDDLTYTTRDLEAAEQSAAEQEARKFDEKANAAYSKATSLYGHADVTNADSPLAKRAVDVLTRLEAHNDPVLTSPDRDLVIVQMAAAELGISPRLSESSATSAPNSPPVQTPATPAPVRRPASPTVIAPATAQTAQPAANAPSAIEQEIDNLSDPEDLLEFEQRYGIGA